MSEERIPLRAIFNQALEIADAHRRAEYLAQVCGADTALRQSIEELIQANQDAGKFLSRPGDSAGSAAERPSSSTVHLATISEKAGDKIGRYKLLQKIGEGGCGVVYMAEQEEPVRRRVALKVIKLGMDTKSVIARFEAERQALALMDHPNIAKVLDAGATETGRPYFVMELVKGVRITDYCDQNNLTTIERLALFTSVCNAIQHAHQKGIIHRDIKPSNILVTMHDGVPVPKVIDFGIAKATTDQRLTDKTLFTAFEQFIGTPAYMSPEQAEMSGLDIDTRSDIYALGVLLYELLTGKPPFDGKELLASGLDAMRRTIREQEPARPSTRLSTMTAEDLTAIAKHRQTEAAKLTSSIRGDLDWIVMKALEKDRTRRYETANGLASDIQRHLRNEPVVARPPGNVYRLQKLVRRNKLVFAGIGAVAAALLIGLGVSTWLLLKERAARQRAVLAEKKAQTEATKSQQVAAFLKKMLEGVGPSKALGRDTVMLREILDKTAESVGRELTNQPAVEVEVRLILAAVYDDLELYPQMEAMARQSLQVARARLGEENNSVARSLGSLGDALMHQGKLDEAEKFNRESLAMTQKLFGDDTTEVAGSLNNLALVLEDQNKLAEAETMQRKVLAMKRRLLGNENGKVAGSLGNLANTLAEQGKLAEAEPLHRQALAMTRKLAGNESPAVAQAMFDLAIGLTEQRKFAEAESLQRQALEMWRKFFGQDHPEVARSLVRLARVLERQARFPESEDTFRKALAMTRKLQDHENIQVANLLDWLVIVLLEQHRPAEAEPIQRQALEIRAKLAGKEQPAVATGLVNLSVALREQGRLGEAEAVQREALALWRKLLGNENRHVAASLDNLARLLLAEGKAAEGEAMLRDVLGMRRKVLGDKHPSVAESFSGLGSLFVQQNRLAEAEANYREAVSVVRETSEDGAAQDSSGLAMVLHHLADVLRSEKAVAEARSLAEEAAAMYQRHFEWQLYERQHAFRVLGRVLTDAGDPASLENWLRKEMALERNIGTNEPSGLETAIAQLATLLRREKRYAEAEPFCRDALNSARNFAANDAPKVEERLTDLADCLRGQKRYAESEVLYREALASARRSAAVDAPRFALRVNELAGLLAAQGKLDEAEREGRAAVAVYAELKASAPTNSFYCQEEAHTTKALARTLEGLGRHDAAAIEYRRAITLYQKASAAFPAQRQLRAALGRLLEQKGAFAGVEGAYRLAAEQYRQNAEGGGGSEDLNALAWILATCPDASVRDGQGAVDLAGRAVAATQRKDDSYLDTLAAAYAEAGQFAEAVKTQKEAMALLRNDEERAAKGYPSRLKLYESGSPCRQSDE